MDVKLEVNECVNVSVKERFY